MQPQQPNEQGSQTPQRPVQPSPKASPQRNEDADYAAASYSTANYAQHAPQHSRPASKHNWRWLIIVFVLLLIGGGVYWFMSRPKAKTVTPAASTTTQHTQTTTNATINATTKLYNSTEFAGLSFHYPTDWKTNETAGSGVLTVTSPALSLKDASGQTQSAAIVFKIRNKQQALPEFDKGNAVAARVSEKIAYTQPSGTQRGSTYISFLQYASTGTTGIDGIYITGDTGYQAAQAIPKADFTPVDPVISLTFVQCTDSPCSPTGKAVTLSSADWDATTLAQPLKTMLASLTIN